MTEAGLRDEFGPEVARIVRAVSDVVEGDTPRRKSPWLLRKRRFVARLRRQDERVRLVAACDKLDNLRSLIADLHAEGPKTLERFHGSPPQIRWYYDEVRRALGDGLPERLQRELDALTAELARFVPQASSRGARRGKDRKRGAQRSRTRPSRGASGSGSIPKRSP